VPQTRKEQEKANKKEKKQNPSQNNSFLLVMDHLQKTKNKLHNEIKQQRGEQQNQKRNMWGLGFLNFSQVFGSTIHFHFFPSFFFHKLHFSRGMTFQSFFFLFCFLFRLDILFSRCSRFFSLMALSIFRSVVIFFSSFFFLLISCFF